ncbi:hypothetical protein BDV18DRAFT_135897 [Aspergillus unguis]
MFLPTLPLFLLLTPALSSTPYRYYLRAKPLSSSTSNTTTTSTLLETPLYVSSSITINGHTNYILLTPSTQAEPLTISSGDGAITLDTSNAIGASSQAPLYLSDTDGLNSVYKQVILGDQMAGKYTTGFQIESDENTDGDKLELTKDGFGGFVACTAAKGIKQVYWYSDGDVSEGDGLPVVCEEVEFERVWDANETTTE